MKPKTAIILSVALALCVVYLAVKVLTPHTPAPPTESELFNPPVTECLSLRIEAASGSTIVFRKRDGHWFLDSPINAPARDADVDALVRKITALTGTQADGADSELTGLDHPLWTVTLEGHAALRNTLQVGRRAPRLGTHQPMTYVRTQDEKVYTVAADLAQTLQRPPYDYRDRTFTDLSGKTIVRIKVAGRESYELTRTDNRWRFVRPVEAPAENTQVQALTNRLAHITADDIVDQSVESLKALGLASGQEALVLTVWTTTATSTTDTKPASAPTTQHTIVLGTVVQNKVYARRADSDTIFLLPAALLDTLQPKSFLLRDHRVLNIAAATAEKLTLNDNIVLANRQGSWQMLAPVEGPANTPAVRNLLMAIAALAATDFTDEYTSLAAFGLQPPQASVTLATATGSQTLLVGAPTSSQSTMRFVKTADQHPIAVVKGAALEPLTQEAAAWYDPTIFKLPAQTDAGRIHIEHGSKSYTLARADDETWTLTEPVHAPADATGIRQMLAHLRNMQAERIVILDRPIPETYLKAPKSVTVTVSATGPQPPATQPAETTLRIVQVGSRAYAWLPQQERVVVGEFPKAVFDVLTAEPRDRTLWQITPADIVGIALSAGNDSFQLTRRDDLWKAPSDPYLAIDTKKVSEFLGRIKTARTDAFAAYDRADISAFRLDKPWFTLSLTLRNGKTLTITVSHTGPSEGNTKYAMTDSLDGVFTLDAKTAAALAPRLASFKAP